MKKRTWGVIALVIVLLVIAVWEWWRHSGRDRIVEGSKNLVPEVQLVNLNITDIDTDEIRMLSRVFIKNNLPATFTADSIEYELWIDSAKVVESHYDKAITVNKNDTSVIELPFELKSARLKQVIDRFEKLDKDSADYTIIANFNSKLPIAGRRNFTVNQTKRLPAIRQVRIKPSKIDVAKLGLNESKLDLKITITNDNFFPLRMKNGKFTVAVEDDLELEGDIQDFVNIPARGSEEIAVQMTIKTAKVPKLGWKMLFRDKQTSFRYHYTGTIVSDSPIMKNSSITLNVTTTLEDVKEFAAMTR